MNGRRLPITLALLLVGCPPARSTEDADATSGDETSEAEHGSTRRERHDLTREGVLALGTYLLELEVGEGEEERVERRAVELRGIRGDELDVVVEGAPRHLARQSVWPMLCLGAPLTYGEGDLRVALGAGAPVYVAASDATHARVGPVPVAAFGRVLERSTLAIEGCNDEAPGAGAAYVGPTPAGDQACVFADADPVDESDGVPIPSGAPLEELEREDAWARVRVSIRGGTIEGWLPSELIASSPAGTPDWIAAALRPERCAFPGRHAASAPPRAWIERSDETVPLPDAEVFERTLRDSDARVRACWDELPPEQRPRTPSRVDVRIGVDGDGQVDLAAVVRSEGAPSALTRCIAERVRRIRFPAPRTGLTLRRTYAFDAYDPGAGTADAGEDEGDDEL